jgi:hypothetical protein
MISRKRGVRLLATLPSAGSLATGAVVTGKPKARPTPKPPPAALDFSFGSRGKVAVGRGYRCTG